MQVTFESLPQYASYVLVDGAFDPLHASHCAYLKAARQYGPLLCAVASDDDIRSKGREPLLPQSSRVAVMEAVCDVVYAKDRPTEQVIERMAPKVYCKGQDWACLLPPEQVSACGRAGTAIYFLLRAGERSAWHRLDAAEVWHHYAGGPLALTVVPADGTAAVDHRLGPDVAAGERPQVVVPAGAWQAAEPLGPWTLVGCTVAPAFDFAGFQLAPDGFDPRRGP